MTNRQVYQTLYRYVFPTAEFVKDMPSQREMEILNMVIESGDMSGAVPEMIAKRAVKIYGNVSEKSL